METWMETWIETAIAANRLEAEAGIKENALGILLSLMSAMPIDQAVAETAKRAGVPITQVQQMAKDPSMKSKVTPAKPQKSNFSNSELSCRCCGISKVDPALVKALEKLRSLCGDKPMIINCAYRCPKHNAKVGGARNSQHVLGKAADIRVSGMDPAEVAEMAEKSGLFGGIGRYSSFTHVDIGPSGRRWNGSKPGVGSLAKL